MTFTFIGYKIVLHDLNVALVIAALAAVVLALNLVSEWRLRRGK